MLTSSWSVQQGLPPSNYDMGVSLPGSNPSGLLYSQPGIGCGLSNHNLLPITHLQRNSMSPQRPSSTGNAGMWAWSHNNTIIPTFDFCYLTVCVCFVSAGLMGSELPSTVVSTVGKTAVCFYSISQSEDFRPVNMFLFRMLSLYCWGKIDQNFSFLIILKWHTTLLPVCPRCLFLRYVFLSDLRL